MLYPIELRAQSNTAPGQEDPDLVALRLVGVEGFEPPTSSSQSWRATRLRYTPRLPPAKAGNSFDESPHARLRRT